MEDEESQALSSRAEMAYETEEALQVVFERKEYWADGLLGG